MNVDTNQSEVCQKGSGKVPSDRQTKQPNMPPHGILFCMYNTFFKIILAGNVCMYKIVSMKVERFVTDSE